MRLLIAVAMMLSILSLSAGCVRNSPMSQVFGPGQEKVAAAPTATVADFVKTYNENNAAADKQYKGKWVKIRGTITTVRKMKWSDGRYWYIVGLKDDTGETEGVLTCRFNFNKESEVLALKTGTTGLFYGLIDEMDNVFNLPTVTDCQVVKK